MENTHKLVASGKDLESVESDLDVAQVRAGLEGTIFTSVLWGLSFREGGSRVEGTTGWMDDRKAIVFFR